MHVDLKLYTKCPPEYWHCPLHLKEKKTCQSCIVTKFVPYHYWAYWCQVDASYSGSLLWRNDVFSLGTFYLNTCGD
jgi:hypothetical protein